MIIPPFFHKYANHKKFINSIWKIADDRGNIVEGFETIAGAAIHHFESLFKEDDNLHLPKILDIAENFPSDISENENLELMIPVTIEEIQSILFISKNDKSPGPDGIPVEVYRALFEVLGRDLLRVVEDSKISGKIPAVFNTTLLL